jgi:RecA-family ATPase
MERIKKPLEEQFIVGSLFPMAKSSVIVGPSGTHKSTLLSQLAFRYAAGGDGDFLGMQVLDESGGAVLVFSAEDSFEDWERKGAAVLASNQLSETQMERARQRVHIVDKSEGEARLSELVQVRQNRGDETHTRCRFPLPLVIHRRSVT